MKTVAGYAAGVFGPVLCIGLKLLLQPWIDKSESPFLFVFIAVFIAAWYFGFLSGLIALTVSVFLAFLLQSAELVSTQARHAFLFRAAHFTIQAICICYITTAWKKSTIAHAAGKRFRHFVQALPDALIITDHEGGIQYVNSEAEHMFGYAAADLEGKDIDILVPERFRSRHRRFVRDYAATPTHRTMQRRGVGIVALKRDGAELPVDVGLTPVDMNGKKAIAASIRDATARVEAEGSLRRMTEELEERVAERTRRIREQAEENQFILDNIPVLIWKSDPTGKVNYVNREWESYTGTKLADIRIHSAAQTFHPEDRQPVLDGWSASVATKKPFLQEARIKSAGGQYRWFLGRAAPLLDGEGNVIEWFGNFVNIDEQKTASERLRLTIDNISAFVSIYTPDGLVIGINKRFLDAAGMKLQDIRGKSIFDMPWWSITEEARELVTRSLKAAQAGKPTDAETVFHIGERQIPVAFSCNAVFDRGRIIQIVSSAIDLTKLRNVEQQLLQAQKMESMGRLAGGVAHDFNNVLTVILGYTQLMLETGTHSAEDQDWLQQIADVCLKAQNMTRSLLSFSRGAPVEPKVLNLNDLCVTVQKLARHLTGEGTSVELTLEKDIWSVKASAEHMQNALLNLIANAHDAGASKIWIRTENSTVEESYAVNHVELNAGGDYVRMTVTDNGSGIEKKNLSRIFEPFFTTKEPGKGTGLGLATTYGTIRQAGGGIWVYSEVGKGTSFRIYLPRTSEALRPAVAVYAPVEVQGSGQRIFLVEDEEPVRRVIRDMLKNRGYEVVEVLDPQDVENACRLRPPDLLITDIVMPGISGFEVARRIRNHCPHVRVIYMSGYTDTAADQLSQIDVSEDYFLEKPFTPRSLAAKLREALHDGV